MEGIAHGDGGQPTLEQLDSWSEQALSAQVQEQRSEAERRLRYYFPTFSESATEMTEAYGYAEDGGARVMAVFPGIKGPADAARLMTWFLRQSTKVYSRTYVVQRLRALVLNHMSVLADEDKADIRQQLLAALQDGVAAQMPGFVVDDVARALGLVVMFTWFEQEESRTATDALMEMGTASEEHAAAALQALRAVVGEFNRELPARLMAKQRRVVVTFRDRQLKAVFTHALDAMRRAIATDTAAGRIVLGRALELQRECLAFDFIGLAPDEASDDAVAIQIPSGWKDVIQADSFLEPYFDGYTRMSPPVSSQFVEVLVQIASLRRSFFTEAARLAFVRRMSRGLADIVGGAIGLQDVDNYHHVCRLLARFRCIHTLVEIEEDPEYRSLLAAAADFTMTGLTLWEWSPNSFAPLLTFWAKVAATHDSRDSSNSKVAGDVIAATLPRVVREFLRAMVGVTGRAVSGDVDNPLDAGHDALLENVGHVAAIARSVYDVCGPVILETLREMAGEYQQRLNAGADVAAVEAQLAWPVYVVAQCISARQPYRALPEDDHHDAELFATVLELDRLVQQRLQSAATVVTTPPSEALELALLQALVAFRASYVGEQGYKVTAVFTRLAELAGLSDGSAVLDLLVQRVLFSLRSWPADSPVVHRTLQLLHDLSAGYVSVRQVARLDAARLLLRNHASDELPFLRGVTKYKPRALYYGALARMLLASDPSETATAFADFMAPWARAADDLMALPDSQLPADAVLRLLRDLRGFLAAVASKPNYERFFAWIDPRMPLIQRCVTAPNDTPVQIAALKFVADLVYNRTQRLNFDVSSPNGILIFRHASRAIWAYGRRLLDAPAPVRDIYKDRYKGIAVCFVILTRLLAGKYVAIGVMPLYGDDALDHAYQIVQDLLRSLPVADVIAYPKLGRAAMSMLEVLLAKSNTDLIRLSAPVFEHAMRLCVEAFDHAETAVSSSACCVIDGLLEAAITAPDGQLAALVRERSDVIQFLLRTMLNIVLFEDRPNDWSYSRPLFCLIVLDREFALQYAGQLVQYQPPERREHLVAALKELLSAEFVLTPANRDAFTQALTQYRREATAKNLILMVPTTQTLGAPVDFTEPRAGAAADDDGEPTMAE